MNMILPMLRCSRQIVYNNSDRGLDEVIQKVIQYAEGVKRK